MARNPDDVNKKYWSFEPEPEDVLADYTSTYQWNPKKKDLLLMRNKYFIPCLCRDLYIRKRS